MDKYGAFDTGFGLNISLDPDYYEDQVHVMIPNVFVFQTSIGKIIAPQDGLTSEVWDAIWTLKKKLANDIVEKLNNGLMSVETAEKLICQHNIDQRA